ncbi:methylenetetrahydrofolate reductase [Corynebacterium spheniscorum]|uniref:Methylenetetrahydrofolate reductase n=1 Tax=Corynebacterium spheniscorum TaxID=185761 RepID=A0A1I2SXG8_9CORY|nr:methylenetetrahydrofolate reductase [Corynebacterium spheniscorum]KAA8724289.1 5,10-methylenetetrahydrofolate reductase [Corynebacterium spheniscorum]SFG57288.1 methylenetetrahydrofolate reductase (NADPH) [Corynebacterium spheniscorum]
MTTALLYRPDTAPDYPTVSFELYPPRSLEPASSVWVGVNRLIGAAPDYVSVTYGAAGNRADSRDRSVQVLLKVLKEHPHLPAVAHLTCLGSTRGELQMIVRLLLHAGIRDFLALRGDMPPGGIDHIAPEHRLNRGVELVQLIREIAAEVCPEEVVSIAVAAYPATRGQARSNDIAALVEKAQAGADYAITQVFYDPEDYASMVRELRLAGCRMPLVPGILPLNDLRRLQALEKLAGVKVPEHLRTMLSQKDPRTRVADSLKATLDLISGVLDAGAPGVHIYSFNRPRPTLDLLEYLRAAGYLARKPRAENAQRQRPQRGPVDAELVGLALRHLTPAS